MKYNSLGYTKSSNALNDYFFPKGVQCIYKYSFSIYCLRGIERKYIAEIHEYDGFSMIKFYPRKEKSNNKRYEIRGFEKLGFEVGITGFHRIVLTCIVIMKDYLKLKSEYYIGFIGQVDKKDDERQNSLRFILYDRIVQHAVDEEYKLITRNSFKEINMRLFRRRISKENERTIIQKENWNKMIKALKDNNEILFEFMTLHTRNQFRR